MEPLVLVIYIVVFLYSVILHEISHGFVANYFGDDTAKISGRLSLNPLVHIDYFGSVIFPLLLYLTSGFVFGYAKPVPVNPYRLKGGIAAYRWVTLAGVLINFILAIVSALILRLAIHNFGLSYNNLGVVFFNLALVINLILAVFNILPLPGFDGFNFLLSFNGLAKLVSKTPLSNPLFMMQYGLMVSLLIVILAMPFINSLFGLILTLFSRIFGI